MIYTGMYFILPCTNYHNHVQINLAKTLRPLNIHFIPDQEEESIYHSISLTEVFHFNIENILMSADLHNYRFLLIIIHFKPKLHWRKSVLLFSAAELSASRFLLSLLLKYRPLRHFLPSGDQPLHSVRNKKNAVRSSKT